MMSNYLMYEKCWNTFRFIEVYMHRLHWSCELWFRSWFVNCDNWKNWCGQECCGNTFLGKNVDLVPLHYQWLRYCKNKNKTVTQFTKCGRHQGLWILENQVFDQQINCYMHLSLLSRSSGVPVCHPSRSNHQRRQKLWKSCLAQKQISRWLFLFTCGGELGDRTIQLYASETESGLQHSFRALATGSTSVKRLI